jgi:methylase of polypeptide subunit release factors
VNPEGPLSLAPNDVREARESLDEAGFAIERILAGVGLHNPRNLDRLPTAALSESLGDEGAGPLARLFMVADRLPLDLAESSLHKGVSFWEELGLVRRDGDHVEALMRIQPDEDFMLVSDWPADGEHEMAPDHVLGYNPTAALLDNITIRDEIGSALDLGTGCGAQGILMAGHASNVVATDLNARAVNIAAFNALLNSVNLECLQGDLFEPVAGRTFDLITSNPPFVISPQSDFLFRDSELGGEGISRRIISGASKHLNENGFCQLLCNWAHFNDTNWEEGLRAAFDGSGCDVWVLKVNEIDAPLYAAGWIRQQESSPQGFQEELRTWLDYYEREGISAISWTFVTMRKRSGADNWFALSELELPMDDRCGNHVKRCFQGYDAIARHTPAELLELCPRVSSDSRLEQSFAPDDEGWSPDASRLVTAKGLPIEGGVDVHVANMLVRCDGKTPLAEIFHRTAEDANVEYEAMLPECLKIAQRLFEGGHLILE